MAILRVLWAQALHPALAHMYHRNRTFSLIGQKGSNVGWDMPSRSRTWPSPPTSRTPPARALRST
eukprot:178033-Pleurochrysis_carterae.AAC.1